VGLRLCDRRDLRTRALYEAAAQAMIEEWARIFGNIPPLRSTDLDAYLSGNYVDVDDL